MSIGGIHVGDLRYLVLVRLLVTNHVCNVSEAKIALILLTPMLVHISLDLVNMMRANRLSNLDHYLKVFSL